MIMGKISVFYHKTKCKAPDKTLEQGFLKEFKASRKNSGNPELKTTKSDLRSHLGRFIALSPRE